MQNLQNELIDLLKHEDNLVIDGHLNKNKIVELALKVEPQLISLLIKNDTFKQHFFQEVENVLVFDKIKFQRFVNNKSFLPDSYTAFKKKIGLITNDDDLDNFISTSNEVVLAWPHKDCVLEGGQTKEDQKRNEIFWNETLAPDSVDRLLDAKVLTNFKKFDKEGEHKLTELRGNENLIIKGNNLLALASLLKTHRGKIKLIYIDPPYNTGSDSFGYNDKFNHSTWLTFMKNRLVIAKKLLKDNGVIFIQCDDNEQAYLKVLCDEIFNRNNFVKTLHVQMSIVQGEKVKAAKEGRIVKNGEYIHVYSNNGDNKIGLIPLYELTSYDTHYSIYVDNNKKESSLATFCLSNEKIKNLLILSGIVKDKGDKTSFTIKEIAKAYEELATFRDFIHSISTNIVRTHTMIELEGININTLEQGTVYEYKHKNGRTYFYGLDNNNKIVQKVPLSDKLKQTDDYYGTVGLSNIRGDWWSGFHIDLGNINKESVVHLDNGQKPERLIENIIKLTTVENDIILDFHLGSGTTAAVAHKMNRRYIGMEQIDTQIELIKKRLKDVIKGDDNNISKKYNWKGGGSFVYAELMQFNQEYVALIEVAETKEQLINIWNEMQDTAFLSYQFDKKTFNERLDAFKTAPIEDMKQYLIEVLDKNQLYVNYSEINDETFNVSQEDKELNKQFYSKK
jgi:adenine-specific DNA-methyltransferase